MLRLCRRTINLTKEKMINIDNTMTHISVTNAAQTLQEICHGLAKQSGWWTNVDMKTPYLFSNKLMLCVSELSEAMEGDRKKLNDDHLKHRPMTEVELADCVIRIFDMGGAFGLDIPGAIAEKLSYNQQRADHKPENRSAVGGKTY
jgi:hypothetical protein